MLAVDIGNSRIKWGWWQDKHFMHKGATDVRAQELVAVLDQHWRSLQPQLSSADASVWVACVAGAAAEKQMRDWLQQHYNIEPVFLRASPQQAGVRHSYSDPLQHGADRWAACLGARALYGNTPVCIIDCGTAVTVDLIDLDGRHLGGRILPGLDMMRIALRQNTAAIRDSEGSVVDFATNTADAVTSGTLHMLRAAIDEICASAAQRLGESMKIIITGGSSEPMIPLVRTAGLHHEPELVLHGLVIAAQQ